MSHRISWSLLALLTGCTAFEGVEPGGAPAGGAAAAGAPGSGGDGGGPAETCLAKSPSCLLPELEAVRLCARVAACDTLATAITRSTGIPIAEIDASGERVGFNFSVCVNWLTGPLQNAHPGFAAVREQLNCAIATSSCENAEDCLAVEPLPVDAAGCDDAACSTFGLGCTEDGCAAAGGPPLCNVPFAQGCDGAVVTSCALERIDTMWLEAHIDCADAGLGCDDQGQNARCAPDAGCNPFLAESNLCSGTSIHLCLQGNELDFDCASAGLSCAPPDLAAGISGRCQ